MMSFGTGLSMRTKLAACFGLVLTVMVLSGCVNTTSATVLGEGGAWTKTVRLALANQANMAGEEAPDLTSMVDLAGEGWTVSVEEKEDETVLTATRSFAAGEEATFTLKGPGGPVAESRGSVSGGDFREVWTYKGPSEEMELTKASEELGGWLAEAAPELSAEKRGEVAGLVVRDAWRIMFGPTDPIIGMFFHPERMERAFKIRIYGVLKDRLTAAGATDAEGAARKVALSMAATQLSAQVPGAPTEEQAEGDDQPMFSLNVVVTAKGKRVEKSNGEVNPVDESVEWSFYPEAAAFEPVVLEASFR